MNRRPFCHVVSAGGTSQVVVLSSGGYDDDVFSVVIYSNDTAGARGLAERINRAADKYFDNRLASTIQQAKADPLPEVRPKEIAHRYVPKSHSGLAAQIAALEVGGTFVTTDRLAMTASYYTAQKQGRKVSCAYSCPKGVRQWQITRTK